MRPSIAVLVGMLIQFAALPLSSAQADIVVFYHNGGTSQSPMNTLAGVTASNSDMVNGFTDTWRTDFAVPTPAGTLAGSSSGSNWWLYRSREIDGVANFDTDYAGFTITSSIAQGLKLSKLSFDLAVAVTNETGGINSDYNVFAKRSTDASFVSLASGSGPSLGAAVLNSFAYDGPTEIDLSSFGTIAAGESVEFRIALADNSSASSKGLFVQGIQLEGAAVPEPSSAALLCLGIVGYCGHRRRQQRRRSA